MITGCHPNALPERQRANSSRSGAHAARQIVIGRFTDARLGMPRSADSVREPMVREVGEAE
jgi:hypothetical protein